jgi:hypothetical protein
MSVKTLMTAGLGLLLGVTAAAEAQVDPTAFYRVVAKHSGKCLDVAGGPGSVANGGMVQHWECNGWDNQTWRFEPAEPGYYRIVAKHSNKVLDVTGGVGATADGVFVQQWDWLGGDNQKWELRPAGDGYYNIIAKHSTRSLDVAGGPRATSDGARAQQWTYLGGDNQKWQLQPPSGPVAQGTYRVTVLGFDVFHETWDHLTDDDGFKDEVYFRYDVAVGDRTGTMLDSSTYRTKIMGDIGTNRPEWQRARVQGGTASATGGFRQSDHCPYERPFIFRGATYTDRLPMVVFEGRLVRGENAVIITPSLWEYDGPTDLFTTWSGAISASAGDIARALGDLATGNRSSGDLIGDGVALGVPALRRALTGLLGSAGDRPIGIQQDGDREVFQPKVIQLNYDLAERAIVTREGPFAPGVRSLAFKDYNRLAGDYTLYVKIEKITPEAGNSVPTPGE